MNPDLKTGVDGLAAAGAAVPWFGWLPNYLAMIAAFLSIVWFALRIWESETVKEWRGK